MHVIILTAVKIRLIKFSGSFWDSSVRRLRKLYFLKILLKVPTRASLLALAKSTTVHCLGHLARNTRSLLENSQSQPAYYCRHTIKWHIGNFLGVRERNRR